MIKFRNSIKIETVSDWELVATDVLDDFLEDFPKREGLTRKLDQEDFYDFDDENLGFMYTQRGMKLYDRMVDRLNCLGNKIFQNETFSYSPSNIKFP